MNLSEFENDNRKNVTLFSEVPYATTTEPCCLGIDEAGRGPVLGPMVYGTCYCPISKKDELKKTKVADSKTLTEEQREDLFTKLDESSDMIGWIVTILSPTHISNVMLRRCKHNLNELSHETAINLIQAVLDKGVNLKEVFVDTVGLPEKYEAKLKGIFPNLDITVAKKADSLYPVVSAASICAKVARDRLVNSWKFIEGLEVENLGSGYPGDPATKKFMAESIDPVFAYPNIVRFSWSTAYNLFNEKCVPVHWDDEDEEPDTKGSASLLTFFKPKEAEATKLKKHAFFTERCLEQTTGF